MSKSVLAVVAAVSALLAADAATAQSRSSSTTRSTTTTTQDGNTTRTETRTTTRSGEVSFDADAAFDALLGMAERRDDPDQGLRRRAEPARPQDVFGDWVVTDGGRDVGDCRFDMRENGFLGIRRIETHDCPSRLGRLSNWRVENGELAMYRTAGDSEGTRLMFVEGRFVAPESPCAASTIRARGPRPAIIATTTTVPAGADAMAVGPRTTPEPGAIPRSPTPACAASARST
ncbi:hypothetical protein [Brevundimonas denitrificans]|uniref:hypothetical protein n=1 Tax=Brevundimonas denitrificans TaxID=1443434 RepID=UPI00223AC2EF|nr:hypothetical protein [Brevundimonas denitrificans]